MNFVVLALGPTGRAKMLTLEITKPTWRAGRVYSKLTTSFGDCGRANSSAEARPRSKFDDVALGRATDFCVLRLRPRKEHVSASWVLEPEDKAAISYKVHEPNSAFNVPNVITVTPHLAEKANEMTSTNKDSKTLLDRDLDR
ncbi:hypothetical protein PS2_002220 [Malus domestica]